MRAHFRCGRNGGVAAVAEAVWDAGGQPVLVPRPDDAAVEAVLRRLLRQLAKTWPTGEPPWAEDEYQRLQEEAVQERLVIPSLP